MELRVLLGPLHNRIFREAMIACKNPSMIHMHLATPSPKLWQYVGKYIIIESIYFLVIVTRFPRAGGTLTSCSTWDKIRSCTRQGLGVPHDGKVMIIKVYASYAVYAVYAHRIPSMVGTTS